MSEEDRQSPALRFEYVNWEGKRSVRTVQPVKVWFGATRWHPEQQWFLKAFDLDKKAERDFALRDIVKIF